MPIQFKNDLLHAIDISDKIVVTEHSDSLDYWDKKSNKSLIPENVIYKKKYITSGEKRQLFRAVKNLDGDIQKKHSLCIFAPHHSIEFYSNGKVTSVMEICFACNEVNWTGTKANPPLSLYAEFENFINDIGLDSKKDWEAEAIKHRK